MGPGILYEPPSVRVNVADDPAVQSEWGLHSSHLPPELHLRLQWIRHDGLLSVAEIPNDHRSSLVLLHLRSKPCDRHDLCSNQ